jgi:TRAP-type mannitol/chloroaromatic compound transport system permease small subunit
LISRLLNSVSLIADRINDVIGRAISWLTLIMVLVTCAVVLVRYVFNLGSIALQESVMYMHGAVFMLGIAFTLKEQAHVRVDVIHERLSQNARTFIELFGNIVFLVPVSLFILIGSIDYVAFSWSLKETSAQPGGLPGVFLVKALIPVMAALLLLQGLSEICKCITRLTSGRT